jgi:hypothetical protein
LDKEIKELEAKMKESGSKIGADVKKGLRELKQKRATLEKEMKTTRR